MLYVLIDNGHGYDTSGKCSPDKTIMEWSYTREIAMAVFNRLLGTKNIMPILITPESTDIPLSERVRRINKYVAKYGSKNCIMISIHLNAAGNGQWMNAKGWSVWTTKGNTISDKLATVSWNIAKELFQSNIRKDMVDGDPDYEANFYIIKGSNCAAILTENLFMDSKHDIAILQSAEGFNNIVAIHVETAKQWRDLLEKS